MSAKKLHAAWAFLRTYAAAQLYKKSLAFYGTQNPIPYSQKPANGYQLA
jgi:hypothetical protein